MSAPTYVIVPAPGAVGGRAIRCLLCDRTSYNPNDVLHKWCDACKVFHEDERAR